MPAATGLDAGPAAGAAGRPGPAGPGGDAAAVVEAAVARLRAQGQRVTPARRAVLRALATTDAHLRADDVCALVEPVAPGVHRATVYRTLEALADLGVVTHVHLGHGATVHHLADRPADEHLHTCCRRCGRVEDVDADLLDGVLRRLARETGFELDPQHVALSGVCRDCRRRQGPGAGGRAVPDGAAEPTADGDE